MKSGFAIFGNNRLHERGDGLFVIGAGQRIGGAVANERVLVILKPGGDGVDDFGDAVLVIPASDDNDMMAVARTCQSESFNAATSGGIDGRIVEVRQRARGGSSNQRAIVPQRLDERGNGSAGSTSAERANHFGPNRNIRVADDPRSTRVRPIYRMPDRGEPR